MAKRGPKPKVTREQLIGFGAMGITRDQVADMSGCTELAALTPGRDDLIRHLSGAGLSLDDIAVIARLSHITVRRRIKDTDDSR